MNLIPGYDAFISTDATVGYQIAQFVDNKLEVTGYPISGQGTTCWAAYSSKTGDFYLSDPLKNQIFEVSYDSNLKSELVVVSISGSRFSCKLYCFSRHTLVLLVLNTSICPLLPSTDSSKCSCFSQIFDYLTSYSAMLTSSPPRR